MIKLTRMRWTGKVARIVEKLYIYIYIYVYILVGKPKGDLYKYKDVGR
jgi:hypothetical protein